MRTYRIKVKDQDQVTYLWGGADWHATIVSNLVLVLQVDETGERTKVTVVRDAGPVALGSLLPEQICAIPLNGIKAVFAQSPESTIVNCEILSTGGDPSPNLTGV